MSWSEYRTWTTTELVGASHFNQEIRDNGNFLRRYVTTANASGSAAPSAVAEPGTAWITLPSFTPIAAAVYEVEVFCPNVSILTGNTAGLNLVSSVAGNLGRITWYQAPGSGVANIDTGGGTWVVAVSLAASAVVLTVNAWGTGTYHGGTGLASRATVFRRNQ